MLFAKGCDETCSTAEDRKKYVALATVALECYVSTENGSFAEEQSQINLVQFIIEQLKLQKVPTNARRYSSSTITTAFLWQLTNNSLYKKLREIFILPTVRRLRQLSIVNVDSRKLDLHYLKQRITNLTNKERIVALMIDEVYTAQRVEYSNGAFIGLTEDGSPAKTVLVFMVQSACAKYKDVVCLVPINRLDSKLLRVWFDKVLVALHDIFFVVAVSVDNHVCNRQGCGSGSWKRKRWKR